MTYLRTEITDGVAVLTLNDPDRRNALNLDMNAEIVDALDTVEADESVGAVVVEPETGRILGTGATAAGGRPHGEPLALAAAGDAASAA